MNARHQLNPKPSGTPNDTEITPQTAQSIMWCGGCKIMSGEPTCQGCSKPTEPTGWHARGPQRSTGRHQ